MDARLNLMENQQAGKILKHFMAVGQVLADSALPSRRRNS